MRIGGGGGGWRGRESEKKGVEMRVYNVIDIQWLVGWMGAWMDTRMDGWMDGWMDG